MEILKVVCKDTNCVLGAKLRPDLIRDGDWSQSTNIFVINSKGQLLCHERSLDKDRWPGAWMTHLGGHVGHDEEYHDNAQKELEEEAGVKVEKNELIGWRTTRNEGSRLWVRDFVVYIDQPEAYFTPQKGEVEKFAWMHFDDIVALSEKTPEMWFAGMHDFKTEYHCMRAVLAAAHASALIQIPQHMHTY